MIGSNLRGVRAATKWLAQAIVLAIVATWSANSASATTTFAIGDAGLETFNITWDGKSESALAGGISLTRMSGSIPSFVTVCTDIGGTVYLGYQYNYSDATPFSGQGGIRPSWGAGNEDIPLDTPWASLSPSQQASAAAAIQAAADVFYQHQSVLTSGNTTEMAALQLAVWAALYNTSANGATTLDGSRFKVTGGSDTGAITDAALWLSEVNPNDKYVGYLLIPTPETQYSLPAQEMFYNVTPVPEASTLIAGALLLLPFGASTLRVLRKHPRS